ncbi:MAG: MBL fold metallo-hydrolase [Candidatus Odinarchaeota archaeon]|nr:MBL fold metallo-hydrolase [Candidatus Odinarchaeota archaeon]
MALVKIKFLGGTREVGASAIQIQNNGRSMLLDYGARLRKENRFPLSVEDSNVELAVISHAHIDHSGAIPLIYKQFPHAEIVATSPTLAFTKILIEDMIRLSGNSLPFTYKDVKKVIKKAEKLSYDVEYETDNFSVTLMNAGHIPGSSTILAIIDDFRIWYSGDINTIETQLLAPAKRKIPDVDAIIIESTYALRKHPPRQDVEREFVDTLRECVERGGVALVPAFSVGRAQEVLSILAKYNFEYPVVLDGMARIASEITLKYSNFIKNKKLLQKALNMAHWVKDGSERKGLVVDPKVIVSPAGMLQGGSAQYYIKHIYSDETSGIYLVGYQVKGTLGYRLLNERTVRLGRKVKKVDAEVKFFELSSHSDRDELLNLVKHVDGDTKVFVVHGDLESAIGFAQELRESYDIDAVAPQEGDTFILANS